VAADAGRVHLAHRLIFIRHGETDWNVERRLQGQKDTPLNPHGREQAAQNGHALRAIEGVSCFDFAASPLKRSIDSMRIIRDELGLPRDAFRIDRGLIEITFGSWEGSTLAELAVDRPDDVRRRQADKWGFVPPGGESYEMLAVRVRRWLESVDRDTVAVSHGAVARVVQGLLIGHDQHEIPTLPAHQDRVFVWSGGEARWL